MKDNAQQYETRRIDGNVGKNENTRKKANSIGKNRDIPQDTVCGGEGESRVNGPGALVHRTRAIKSPSCSLCI